jgi:hypothetical protein
MVSLVDLFVLLNVFYVPLSSSFLMILDNNIKETKREIRDLEWKIHQLEKREKTFKS